MPSTREIEEQIKACESPYIFWTRKEIRALPELLLEGEIIHALTSGLMDGNTWLAVCTNRRLFFIDRGMVYGIRQVQVPLERIQSIDHESKLLFGSIKVFDGSTSFLLRWVLKSSILPFIRATQKAILDYKQNLLTRPQSAANAPTMGTTADELEKLAGLLEKGLLTHEEFQEQKKKLLS